MALNLIQRTIQRSIFEAIRLVLVGEGYLPDIETFNLADPNSRKAYEDQIGTIASGAKKFAIELFNHSSNQFKGLKNTPRIAINPRRVIPGDIGFNVYEASYTRNTSNPDTFTKTNLPFDASNLQLEINLVSSTSEQAIVLNAVLQKALGVRKFINLHGTQETFLIRQYDYFEATDSPEGVMEDIYSYQVDDLVLNEEVISTSIASIKEITLETTLLELKTLVDKSGNIIGPYAVGDDLVIDLSGLKF